MDGLTVDSRIVANRNQSDGITELQRKWENFAGCWWKKWVVSKGKNFRLICNTGSLKSVEQYLPTSKEKDYDLRILLPVRVMIIF